MKDEFEIYDIDTLKTEFEFTKIHQRILQLEVEHKHLTEERDRLMVELSGKRLFVLSKVILYKQEIENQKLKQEREKKE